MDDSVEQVRRGKLTAIELIATLFVYMGKQLSSLQRKPLSDDSYEDDCIYQFFAFIQRQPLANMIFVEFISIVGSVDRESGELTEWKACGLSCEQLGQLKEIRNRYKAVRNKLICHIDDDRQNYTNLSVSTEQISKNIQKIRDILNCVALYHKRSPVIGSMFRLGGEYCVVGLERIFKILHAYAERADLSKCPGEEK